MMLSQAIVLPQLLHLNRKHRVLPATSLNCRRKILSSRIMSSKAILPPSTAAKFSLVPHLANPGALDVYEQLNQNVATEFLKTKLGFSNEDIHRLTDDEISNIMEAECVKIPCDEVFSIVRAEIYKLPRGKHKRLMKAYAVRRFPFAKFLIDLLIPTNLGEEEEDDKESMPSAQDLQIVKTDDNQGGSVEAT